jgi:hypothetical protein
MIGPDLARGLADHVAAEFAALAAALSYALASIFARRFRGLGMAPFDVAAGQVAASSLMLAPLALAVDRPWDLPTPSLAAAGAVIAIASLSTALAYVVYFRILAGAGARRRRDQCRAGDPAGAGDLDPAWSDDPRRAAGGAPFRRPRAYRRGPRLHRRTPAERVRRARPALTPSIRNRHGDKPLRLPKGAGAR